MNLGQYRADVRSLLGLRSDEGQAADVDLNRAINAALAATSTVSNWPWLFVEEDAVLAAFDNELLPPPYWTTTEYVAGEHGELVLASRRELRQVGNYVSGTPWYWAPAGDRILVGPPTSSDLTLVHGFYRTEPTLVADTDAPLLPPQYDDWAVTEAAMRVALRLNNRDRAELLRQEAVEWRGRLMDNARKTTALPSIRRTRPSIWQNR